MFRAERCGPVVDTPQRKNELRRTGRGNILRFLAEMPGCADDIGTDRQYWPVGIGQGRECVQREEVLEMRSLFIRTTGADLQRTQWTALVARPGTAVAVAASTSLWGIDRSVSGQGLGSGGALSPRPRAGAGPAVQSERPAFIVPARGVPLLRADRDP